MKMIKPVLALLFLCAGASAQTPADSIRIEGFIPIHRSDPAKFILRHQADMDAYEKQNREAESLACDVLMVGSSTINLWEDVNTDLAPLKVIRRGYGGSTIRDILYNYNTVARGFSPRKILLYVENDLERSPYAISVGEAYDLFRLFTQRIRRDYPGVPFYIVSIKPSPLRAELLPSQKMFNALMADYASRTPGVHFIDITKAMYDPEGNLREDAFLPDGVHMNRTGYRLWTSVIKPALEE